MNAPTWPTSERACYGVGCYEHAGCARYAAVDNNSNPDQLFMGCCGMDRADFIPLARIQTFVTEPA